MEAAKSDVSSTKELSCPRTSGRRTISFRVQERNSTRSILTSPTEREPLSYQEPLSYPGDSMDERRSFYSDDGDGDEGTPSHRSHLSTMSRGIALSPRGTTHSKATRNLANNFSTSRFLCATIVNRPPSSDDNLTLPPHQQRKTVGTVLSRSVILSPAALQIHRRSSSRNVKILELPINKRLSVPWDDLYQSDAAPSSPTCADAQQERGQFLRRTNSDVVWGETIVSELKLPIPKLGERTVESRPGPILLPTVTTMRRAQSKIDSDMTRSAYSIRSASSTSHMPLSSGLLSRTIRRQPVVPALDQMALDLRAGWMGEDDVEDELQDLDLFDAKENTRINRSGEVNSIFELGQCIVANEDIDYYCGIVPAGTMGTILRISQWRLFVTWHLRNFEKYGECEVCPYEVSTELENIEAQSIARERSRPNAYSTLLTERYNTEFTANSTGKHIEFNMDITEWIEPPPILRQTNFARSTKNSAVEKNVGLFTTT